ncbi:MAG: YbaB/EbfC family nucleoid-associated protein [Clostridia bacterium]
MANNKFGGGMNMQQLAMQAQKMQQQVMKAQEELENMEIDGQAGNGLVTVTLTGQKKLVAVKIKPEAVDVDDLEMLEDLIVVAYNYAAEEADKAAEEIMPSGMNGLI